MACSKSQSAPGAVLQLERASAGDEDAARAHLALPRDGSVSFRARELRARSRARRAVVPGGDVGAREGLASELDDPHRTGSR